MVLWLAVRKDLVLLHISKGNNFSSLVLLVSSEKVTNSSSLSVASPSFLILKKDLVFNLNVFFFFLVLIEKILRTAPDVGKIYVLIKAKSKESAIKRLKCEV